MDLKALESANRERVAAKDKLELMEKAADHQKLTSLWSEFLTCTQRFFNKFKKATENGPSKRISDRAINQTRNDDLLLYVLQARHVDEHGIEPITDLINETRINARNGRELFIDHMEIRNGQIILGPAAAASAKFEWRPHQVRLVPVTNRGVTYKIPQQHLGKPISDPNPLSLSRHVIEYIDGLMEEAGSISLRQTK